MFHRAKQHFAPSLIFLATLLCLSFGQVKADSVIFETAVAGPPGQETGTFIDSGQYLGARFQLSSPTQITAVGGHLGTFTPAENLFAAIVGLSDSSAFPTGTPSDFTPLAFKEFAVPFPSADILADFNLTIGPGNYALIFGSGRFGATGSGFVTIDNDSLSYNNFFSVGDTWLNDPLMGSRFVIVGEAAPVPEPATMLLLGTGLAALGAAVRKRRQTKGN